MADGKNALHCAIEAGQVETVRALLEYVASEHSLVGVTLARQLKLSSLFYVSCVCMVCVVRMIFISGCNCSEHRKDGTTWFPTC